MVRLAEWQHKKKIMVAWPAHEDLWQENLLPAQKECLGLILAMLKAKEHLVIITPNESELNAMAKRLGAGHSAEIIALPYGDIWVRDTGPIAVQNEFNQVSAVIPTFNGWGKKYLFPNDLSLSRNIAAMFGLSMLESKLVFEGGALEFDGLGTLMTTKDCLIDEHRNPGWSKDAIEQELIRLFKISKICWLNATLKNDHTDGHIDTLARFIKPGVVAIMKAEQDNDPNREALESLKAQLLQERDALGRPLKLVELPSPGTVMNSDGEVMPASYLNFIIGNNGVYMPVYGEPFDQKAQAILQGAFDVPVIPLSARAILTGGGAFHCMSQEVF